MDADLVTSLEIHYCSPIHALKPQTVGLTETLKQILRDDLVCSFFYLNGDIIPQRGTPPLTDQTCS